MIMADRVARERENTEKWKVQGDISLMPGPNGV